MEVSHHYFQALTEQELRRSKEKLRLFDISEQKQFNLSEIKNKLEGFIYHIREIKDLKDFHLFSKEEEREKLVAAAEEHAKFIDNLEGPAKFKEFKTRYDELIEIMTPLYVRLEEAKARPKAINDTIDMLKDVQKKINAVRTTMPWITEADLQEVIDEYNNFSSWLKESLDQQEKMSLDEDPVFVVSQIKDKFELITKAYSRLRTISKPKKVLSSGDISIKEKGKK